MDLTITNRSGERIANDFEPGNPSGADLVVLGHGVTSDKDRPWSRALSRALHEAGIASMRISFAGNGQSEGRFEDATITKEVQDLRAVLDALPDCRIAYVGHSMGGAVGLLCAAADERIHALVSLAAIAHTAEFAGRMFGHLSPGDLMLDKPKCPLSTDFMADLERIGSVIGAAPEVHVPWLLVHGTEDEIVPVQDSRDVQAATGGHSKLVELPGAGHSFTGDALRRMVAVVAPWLIRTLER
jgi:pimeloyl-ACP methyl ester carboxylesterase